MGIPDDVVDKRAYYQYLALGKNKLLVSPYFTTSDGELINMKLFPSKIRELSAHLSPAEQQAIIDTKTKYNQLLGRRGGLKRLAFRSAGAGPKRHKTAVDADCVELLGKMFTPAETVQILGEEYGLAITEKDVAKIFQKNLVEIERLREDYRNKVTDVRLYNKRSRLEELGWMYSRMKQRYVVLNSDAAYSAMLRTLEQIRKEAEGDVLTVNGAVDVNVEVQIQNHIQAEIYKTINLKEIILGRVAARMGYDLGKLVAGLHNSYYARFVQLSGQFDPNAQMVYPSTNQYDFSEIARHVVDGVEDIKAIDVTIEEQASAESTKEIFLQKIKQQREREEQRLKNINELADAKRPTPSENDAVNRPKTFAANFTNRFGKVPKNAPK